MKPRSIGKTCLFTGIMVPSVMFILIPVVALLIGQPFNLASVVRLPMVVGFGVAAIRGFGWARWTTVVLLGIWSLEQVHWSVRGNSFALIAAPLLLASTVMVALPQVGVFIKETQAKHDMKRKQQSDLVDPWKKQDGRDT